MQELVDDCQPHLLCLVETHMQVEEQIKIPGYETIYRNDKTYNSGGIIIAVHDTVKTISMEVRQESEVGQMLWVMLNNQQKKIKVGIIYAPQEGVTPNKELKKLYTSITEEIIRAKEEDQQTIIIGDFNAKIGDRIQGNTATITKGGRQLMKMVDKYEMKIVNENKEICKGLWTREQGKEKSVIDYVITEEKYIERIKEVRIDEEKDYATFRIDKNGKAEKKVYSDHNVIMIKLDFVTDPQQEQRKKIITNKGYKEYKKELQEKEISEIVKYGPLQDQYDIWSQEIEETIKKVEKTKKKYQIRKDVKELNKIRKGLRKQYKLTTNIYKRKQIIERIKLIKEQIVEKRKESRGNKINKVADEIKRNVKGGSPLGD